MPTSTIAPSPYAPKKWNLAGLAGISDKTLELHFGLYEGYVKNANLLNEQIADKLQAGKVSGSDPGFAEITRRLGFEYNGMVLHEYYFDNLMNGASGPPTSGGFYKTAGESFGDFETWKRDFAAIGAMRGVGWAVAYQDPNTGRLSNHWITLHEHGNVAGFKPILVMDIWEHAYLLDYKPSDRPKYIEAFFANVDWTTASARLLT